MGLLLVAALLALPALSASAKPLEVKSVEAPEEVYCDWAYPITVTLASYRDAYIKAEVKAFLDGSEVPLKLPHVEFLGPMERTYVFALQVPGEAGEHTLKVAIYFEGVEVDAKEVKFKAKPFLPTFKSLSLIHI